MAVKKKSRPPRKRERVTTAGSPNRPLSMQTKLSETDSLLRRLKADLGSLNEVLKSSTFAQEDLVYRYYHQSFKVYLIQCYTEKIVAKLQSLAPHLPLNDWFMEIVRQGTGREFSMNDNNNWTAITGPMLEAFFHARYFLEMACKFGRKLNSAPNIMPSGWAALLYLYNLR